MEKDWLVFGIVFVLFSFLIIGVAIKNPKWFEQNYRVQNVIKLLGSKGATAFYIFFAILVMIMGILGIVYGLVK